MTLPIATYRLQLNKDFTLQDTTHIADYLRELNISHLYLSPLFSSAPGSNHGYDGTDFTTISDERGGIDGFQALTKKICAYDYPMKIILDIVPNHMATSHENPYWIDVLKNGPSSRFWNLFDLRNGDQKIRLPVLTCELQEALKDIRLSDDKKSLLYFDTTLPLNTPSLEIIPGAASIEEILDLQHYQLVPWTDIADNISYRRFFDVTSLIGVRVEDKIIYDLTHEHLFSLLRHHKCIDGVRIDHIDGLARPAEYLERLSDSVSSVWIEKILSRDEDIAEDWKTEGTTGYEFIDHINQLFTRPGNFEKILSYWIKKTGCEWTNFSACVWDSKKQVLNELFKPELERLVNLITDSQHDKARLFWTGLTLGLDVYRVYNNEGDDRILKASNLASMKLGQEYIEAEKIFLPGLLSPKTENQKKSFQEWQQLSGPVMAKGLEDTAHYRFTPLAALNEVGCAPELNATEKNDFFNWINDRTTRFPKAINASSTHDTKRSEDTRCRLYALSDMPEKWIDFFEKSQSLNLRYKKDNIPSAETEYFIYQSILGTWPLTDHPDKAYRDRIKAYFEKANREARQNTSWTSPAEDYESIISDFIDGIFDNMDFVDLVDDFSTIIAPVGAINSLSALTLKILLPGIPDIYQGSEDWEFNLVDPDNRRPVDFTLRQEKLFTADDMHDRMGQEKLIQYLLENWKEGTVKIWLTRQLLRIRQQHLVTIEDLQVKSLKSSGTHADNLIAYKIGTENSGLIVLCPRYPGQLDFTELQLDWKDTAVILEKESNFHDLINDKPLKIEDFQSLNRLFSLPVSIISYN